MELIIDDSHISGVIGSARVDLTVERDGNKVSARGLIPGALSHFVVDESGMRGRISRCMYDLERTPAGFTGRRACGSTFENFTLELPDAMTRWTDAEIVAVFALFLGHR